MIFKLLKKVPNPVKFLPDRLVISICTVGPVGRWGRAPGTSGTVLGLALYTLVFFQLDLLSEILLTAVLAALAVLFCGEGERRMQKRDPGEMIIDEVVAVPLCFLGLKGFMAHTGGVWMYMLCGFLLFRLYDILKPFGIRNLQKYHGGTGVVIDDLAAAVATNLTLRIFLFAYAFGGWEELFS